MSDTSRHAVLLVARILGSIQPGIQPAALHELIVRADNIGAIKLYERHGFELEGRLRDYMIVDGVAHDALAMARRK